MLLRIMSPELKAGFALIFLLGGAYGVTPAAAETCSFYDCAAQSLDYPQAAPYAHYHYLGHGSGHDDTPMAFSDGRGGQIPGRWYWGGNAWSEVAPHYYDQYRGGRW